MTGSKDPAEDLTVRWWPTARSVRHARALLAAEPAADLAVVPMYQPDKQYGIWFVGQPVFTVPGVVFIAVNSFEPADGVPSLSWARNAASDIARCWLRIDGRVGTVAYAVIEPDNVAVFEEYGDLP
ncbi:hypothetical protein [Actinophytocola sediminis]